MPFLLTLMSYLAAPCAMSAPPVAVEDFGEFYAWDGPVQGPPGTVLRVQEVEPLAPDSRAWRVLYVSTAANGERVPVSGLVAAPVGAEQSAPRAVVSWAHGTKGVNDACAPSRGFRISHNFFDIAPQILAQGWIAVATDYEGLGTPGVHPYLVSASEAYGQADIVRAAQSLPEVNASTRYVAWGRSQGGHASLSLAEYADEYAAELSLLGVVSAAPVGDMPLIFLGSAYYGLSFNWLVAAGLRAAWDLDLAEFYDAAAVADLDKLIEENTACYYEFTKTVEARGGTGVNIFAIVGLYPYLSRSSLGNRPIDVPVLVSQGSEDKIVPKYLTDWLVNKLCEAGAQVAYLENEGESHNDSTFLHMPELIAWTSARFAGAAAPGCQTL